MNSNSQLEMQYCRTRVHFWWIFMRAPGANNNALICLANVTFTAFLIARGIDDSGRARSWRALYSTLAFVAVISTPRCFSRQVIHCSGYLKVKQYSSGQATGAESEYDDGYDFQNVGLVAVGHSLPHCSITEIKMCHNMFMFRACLDLRFLFLDTRYMLFSGFLWVESWNFGLNFRSFLEAELMGLKMLFCWKTGIYAEGDWNVLCGSLLWLGFDEILWSAVFMKLWMSFSRFSDYYFLCI